MMLQSLRVHMHAIIPPTDQGQASVELPLYPVCYVKSCYGPGITYIAQTRPPRGFVLNFRDPSFVAFALLSCNQIADV